MLCKLCSILRHLLADISQHMLPLALDTQGLSVSNVCASWPSSCGLCGSIRGCGMGQAHEALGLMLGALFV